MSLRTVIDEILGDELPLRLKAYDGTDVGPADAPATVVVKNRNALRRIVQAPGELGFARAFVAGDIDIEGDLYAALSVQDHMQDVNVGPKALVALARHLGRDALRPVPPPPEEARVRGRRHSRRRDADAIAHHYDVSNDFYRAFLGRTMTYSCAVFEDGMDDLDRAQENKYELICRKLALRPGQRLLDIGCGWGGMVIHAARHHGVSAVGVTVSRRQADLAAQRVAEAGLADRVEIRFQDYRDITDGPFDAISSIGMFEHVGVSRLKDYFGQLKTLVPEGGRLLNHQITRPPFKRAALERAGFMNRYVFPDGELMEIGKLVSAMQDCGFEVRHDESLREHYARTLRHWVANLEANWDLAVAETSLGRARTWRLYMAGAAVNFEANKTQIHQVMAINLDAGEGMSGLPMRPDWENLGPLSTPAGLPARANGHDRGTVASR
ncbi:MAG: class I SAM-dependent methyltransferase [Actinomycetota bacterium]|nr:class I SAM-dependent methyltransferase [Actinomycetota bacterium]